MIFGRNIYDPCPQITLQSGSASFHRLSLSLSLLDGRSRIGKKFVKPSEFILFFNLVIFVLLQRASDRRLEIESPCTDRISLATIVFMDRMCGFRSSGDYSEKTTMMISSSENLISPSDYQNLICSSAGDNNRVFGSDGLLSSETASIVPRIRRAHHDDINSFSFGVIKSRIACHPLYPRLLETYIDCQKVIFDYHKLTLLIRVLGLDLMIIITLFMVFVLSKSLLLSFSDFFVIIINLMS